MRSLGQILSLVLCSPLVVSCSHSQHGAIEPQGAAASPPDGEAGANAGQSDVVGSLPNDSVRTALPPLPGMTNVVARQRNDSVGIDFDPVDGASDYRVYVLPDDSSIHDAGGSITIDDAVYRCSGTRQTWAVESNVNSKDTDSINLKTRFDADSQKNVLGYVYLEPSKDRLPVYALGANKDASSDDEEGWNEARLKIYTTDAARRATLLSQGFRDDGVVFYVPASASDATRTVYESQDREEVLGQGWTKYHQYYFIDDSKASHADDSDPPAPAFQVLTAQATGATPLMAVFYSGTMEHTELAAGKERFLRAAYQGNGPLWHLEWSGLTKKTTLVVEALDSACPFQGFLAPEHIDASGGHQAFLTLDDLKKASPAREVFVNGQGDPKNQPRAIARAFLTVEPRPLEPGAWDWYSDFRAGSSFGTVEHVEGCTDFNCDRWRTSDFDFSVYRIEKIGSEPLFAYGQFLGQFWVAYDDAGSDVTGKVRFTARKKATVPQDANQYLHVTVSMDVVSTDRRYPQLIVSDQDAPVQEGLANPNNNTLLFQPIQGPDMRLEVQAIHGLVNGDPWDVNNQAPEHRLIDTESAPREPSDWVFEHAGMDRLTRFDVYVSSERLYAFMDGKPAGCTHYPPKFVMKGPVTVSFGDVLYHEGAEDELVCSQSMPYRFLHEHQCSETKRHFDDFGFKSGAGAPPWNDALFPCRAY